MLVKEELARAREITQDTFELTMVPPDMHIHVTLLVSGIVTLVAPEILYLLVNTPHMFTQPFR